ncbi:variable large family protein (plasmid) [Borrelia parkeri]|nr:variable large family protein [Borrelia parkeri]
MVGGVLGFNTNTKKSDVGNYFKKIHDTVSSTKRSLNKIVTDMKSKNNPNADSAGTAVKKLIDNTLNKIIEGAGDAVKGAEGDELLGNVAADNNGGVVGTGVDSLVKGIKSIVDVVLQGKGNPDAGDNKKAEDLGARDNDAAGKLFANNNAGATDAAKKSAADAAKAVGAVTGADILQAIVKDNGDAATGEIKIEEAKNAAEIAAAKKDDDKEFGDTLKDKDAVIAGGIALRAMAKDGKFAAKNDDKSAHAVNGAAASAVGKTLSTLIIAIRNTVDSGLKTISDSLVTVTQEDKTAEAEATGPSNAAASSGQ